MNSLTYNRWRLATLSLLVALSFLMAGCTIIPRSYSAAPLGGRVVDRETGQPIAGAYVVATYVLKMGMEGGASTPLHYEETRTDHEGRFHFNGFETTRAPTPRAARNATLQNEDPSLHFFAEGYHPDRLGRDPLLASRTYPLRHRVSSLDGRDFGVRPLGDASIKQQADSLDSYTWGLVSSIGLFPNNTTGISVKCAFTRIPMTLQYLIFKERELHNKAEGHISFKVPVQTGCK